MLKRTSQITNVFFKINDGAKNFNLLNHLKEQSGWVQNCDIENYELAKASKTLEMMANTIKEANTNKKRIRTALRRSCGIC